MCQKLLRVTGRSWAGGQADVLAELVKIAKEHDGTLR
jgi:hypothetical protein